MSDFSCPADNNTLQWFTAAPAGRQLYIVRCRTSFLSNLDDNVDVTQSDVTRSQCLILCHVDPYCLAWNFVPSDPNAIDSATNFGNCYGWTVLDSEPDEPNERLPTSFGPDSDDGTNNLAVIKAPYWAGYDQIYYAPPTVQYITTVFVTLTSLTAYPFTTVSVVTSTAIFTSAITQTATISTVLPDRTATFASLQVVPTTIVSLQIFTTTIVQITTQQIVTVVPTVVPTTVIQTALSTLALQSTLVNTQLPVTTTQRVQSRPGGEQWLHPILDVLTRQSLFVSPIYKIIRRSLMLLNPSLQGRGWSESSGSGTNVWLCFESCATQSNCMAWDWVPDTPVDNNVYNSGDVGTCSLYTLNDYVQGQSNPRYPINFGPNAVSGGDYRLGGVRVRDYARINEIYFPPAQLQYRSTAFVTQTLVTAFPVTIVSTISRLVTITTTALQTTTIPATLPDATAISRVITAVPITTVVLQVFTTTIVQTTTQQIVTVVPIVQTATAIATASLQTTIANTATATAVPLTTVRSTRQAQQTVTVTN
ncbi:hypothetical protein BST61_g1084 [Cercospora zeina]